MREVRRHRIEAGLVGGQAERAHHHLAFAEGALADQSGGLVAPADEDAGMNPRFVLPGAEPVST